MTNETITLWFARWKYTRPTLCRVKVVVRPSTYKVVEYQTFLGYWVSGIVYPKDSPNFFEDVGGALNFLRIKGQEVEQDIINNLRKVQGHNKRLSELIGELDQGNKINFTDV